MKPPRPRSSHPRGLYLLFSTEMWERMSFYGLRALLVLYLVDKAPGGAGWSHAQALNLYGWYAALVYLTPLVGGYLTDRFLGQRRAVLIGGALMMMGQFLLALPGYVPFFAGLAGLVSGNGLFKPNISTLVGGLYREGDARRDSAFSIFYMGINIGAFLASIVCGTLGEKIGWHVGFASAGAGMALGVLVFWALHRRLLGDVGLRPARSLGGDASARQEELHAWSREERDRIITLFILVGFAALFWLAFEQAGGLMSLYAKDKVDRVLFGWEIPATWFQAVNAFFIILLSPVFAKLWLWLAERNRDPSPVVKMGWGLLLAGMGFGAMVLAAYQNSLGHKANPLLLVLTYLFHTVGELCLSPVGLSLVTKLAPRHLASRLMGIWFLSNAIGNYLAGFIGGKASQYGDGAIFGALAIGISAVGLVLLLGLSRTLTRWMHGAADIRPLAPVGESAHPAPETSTIGG